MRIFWVRAIAFVILFLALLILGLSLERVTLAFGRLQPENYAAVARQAMRQGDLDAAERIVEKRLSKHFYDFDALYLYAEIKAHKREFTTASEIIREVFRRVPGAKANDVAAYGYDEAKTYFLLAKYLWRAGACEEAAEMMCAALDAGYSLAQEEANSYMDEAALTSVQAAGVARVAAKIKNSPAFLRAIDILLRTHSMRRRGEILLAQWMETVDKNLFGAQMRLRALLSTSPGDPAVNLALANVYSRAFRKESAGARWQSLARETTGAKVVGAGLFRLSKGNYVDSRGIVMGRNGTASARIFTGAYRVTRLVMNVTGTWAIGMYPVLVVRVDDKEICRLYVDGLQPHLFDLSLWPQGAPKDLSLELEFINDAFEPLSGVDRNVIVHDVILY